MNIFQALIIFLHSLVAFGALLLFTMIAKEWSPWAFSIGYWVAVAVIYFLVFCLYARFHDAPRPLFSMMIAVILTLAIHIVFFTFIYTGDLSFLTWYDYVVAVVVAASAVYLAVMCTQE